MLKQVFILFFLVAAAFAETAYFSFQTQERGDEFIVEFTKDNLIKHARDLLSGETEEDPHLMGRIRKSKKDYNPKYDYYLDPDTINFFNHAIEVCDASFTYANDYIDEACGAFLPGCIFCPWTSRIVREVKSFKSYDFQQSFRAGVRHHWSNEQNCS